MSTLLCPKLAVIIRFPQSRLRGFGSSGVDLSCAFELLTEVLNRHIDTLCIKGRLSFVARSAVRTLVPVLPTSDIRPESTSERQKPPAVETHTLNCDSWLPAELFLCHGDVWLPLRRVVRRRWHVNDLAIAACRVLDQLPGERRVDVSARVRPWYGCQLDRILP